ncbi:MAG: hypothetical protein ACUVXH_07715 [Anaerolineae bacterium]
MKHRTAALGMGLLLALVPSATFAAGSAAATEGLSPWSILASAGLMALGLISLAVGAVGLLQGRRRAE